jgi:hypothetical protein
VIFPFYPELSYKSYRQGRVMAFDPAAKRVLKQPLARKIYLPQGA